MKPLLVITHARFRAERRLSLNRLVAQLNTEAPDLPVHIEADEEGIGSYRIWRRAMEAALLDPEVTHVVWLPDDVTVCKDFGRILTACIDSRPSDVFDCFVNSPWGERAITPLWYEVPDGFCGIVGVMPRAALTEFLRWRDAVKLPETYSPDGGVCLWAIATGRKLFKTSWSLAIHDAGMPSLCGHDGQAVERTGLRFIDDLRDGLMRDVGNLLGRTYAAPEHSAPGVRMSTGRQPKVYAGNHWDMVKVLPPSHWNLDGMYQVEQPLADHEHVVMLVPCYRETEETLRHTRPSRHAVADDLTSHGVECTILEIPGDSHVDRMRNRATHEALKRGATHVLWWDADIEALDPKCVRRMLLSKHDVIAGCCPFKNTTRNVVVNLWPEMLASGQVTIDGAGCLEVQDAGTGFMLVSRKALLSLMQRHPETLHYSRMKDDAGEPLFALWDAQVHEGVFLTEDYNFCRRWQEAGGKVYVDVHATFRHWGLHGYEGSLVEQLGLRAVGA